MSETTSERHCETCYCGRRAPVQGDSADDARGRIRRAAGTVTWAEHLEAYAEYAAQYGRAQSAERLAERGGFGYYEIADLLGHEPTTWRAR
jgi:hypothetical protein